MAGGLYRPLSAEFGGFGTFAQHRYADCPFACERSGSHAVDVQTVLSAFFVSGTGRSCQQLRPWKGYTNLFAARDCFVELDIFGKVTTAKRRAKAAYEQSKEYEQAVKTQLVASVANTYYTLLMLDSQYEIAVATEAAWKESVNATRAMKK